MITLGYETGHHEHNPLHKQIAIVGCVILPFVDASQNILMSTMKGVNAWTTVVYICIVLPIILGAIMLVNDPSDFKIFLKLSSWDWILISIFALFVNLMQTTKFRALQLEEPAKLSPYLYLSVVYQLILDTELFGKHFSTIQSFGLAIMFISYTVSTILMYRDFVNEKEQKERDEQQGHQDAEEEEKLLIQKE